MSQNRVMVAAYSTAYSVPTFQVKGGFGNLVPCTSPVLEVKHQLLED